MKLAIISTTIHGERTYLPFDALAAQSKFSDVTFVVAGDTNAAPFDTSKFQCRVEYLEPVDQERFAVSETIGWKTPRRRPIAWLRAVELGPDYILSVDDDNIPPENYFNEWYRVLTTPVASVAAAVPPVAPAPWHNYLRTSDAPIEIYPRGFPLPFRQKASTEIQTLAKPVPPAAIGLFQGISLGDPDMDAMTRLVYPKPLPLNTIVEKNYVLRGVWSPYNMQNTVFSKVLFQLPILWPHAGRFDDIFASFVWQKFLFNNGRYVHVGDPVNRQDRGVRDTLNLDFREEVEGYLYSHRVWEVINAIAEKDPIAFLRKLMEHGDELAPADSAPNIDGAGDLSLSRHLWSSPAGEKHIIARHRDFFSAHIKDVALGAS